MTGTGSPAFRYYAFISYSHQDKTWADWLHKALETYVVPKRLVGQTTAAGVIPKRLTPIFRDRDELASANDLSRKVSQALTQSANLIVICSPHSAASRWVDEEVRVWKRMGQDEHVFCLIVNGEPNASDLPGRAAEECFVPALRFQFDAGGHPTREPSEPIAADVRGGRDGKHNAKLKLVAGLLDVGFDALKQRELHRKMQRMIALTSLALVVTAVTSALALSALISRHDALVAQRKAVVAQEIAERRQKQAESLVGFMLGDLNDKLNNVVRLDVRQALDDKALAYFGSLTTADATDSALALRVSALQKIGSVRMDQGPISSALQAYQAATTLAAELARRAPGNADRAAAYGDSLKWVGQAFWYQGDLGNALENFQAATALLEKAHKAKPDDDDLTFKLAMARNDAGHVREARGDFDAAQQDYSAYLEIFQTLHQREPTNTKWKSYLGSAWNNLGKVELERGHLDRAVINYHADQQIKAAIVTSDPADHNAQSDLLVSNAILGRTLALCGEDAAALRYTQAAVASAKQLAALDPGNSSWQSDFALYNQQFGGLLRQNGQFEAAAIANHDAVRILTLLAARDPTDTNLQQNLARSELEQSRLQLARGETDAAAESATFSLTILKKLRAKTPDDQTLILLAGEAHSMMGLVAARRHRRNMAQQHWMTARDLLAATARAGNDVRFMAAYATALLRLGDIDGARPLIARLSAMGYRTPDFVASVSAAHVAYPINAAFTVRIADIMQEAPAVH